MKAGTVISTLALVSLCLLNGCTLFLTTSVAISNSANKAEPVQLEAISGLERGAPVEVHLRNGTLIRGNLVEVNAGTIGVEYADEVIVVLTTDVLTVSKAPKRNKLWPAVVFGVFVDTVVVIAISNMKLGLGLNF